MATEWIECDGKRVETLAELIGPGVRACFVGINPSPVSVRAGHYYQGQLGQRFWSRLRDARIAGPFPPGKQDTVAHEQGLAFADLYRCPSARADDLKVPFLRTHAHDLAERIEITRPAPVVFVFKKALDAAGPKLESAGRRVLSMPGPYAATDLVREVMSRLADEIGTIGARGEPRRPLH